MSISRPGAGFAAGAALAGAVLLWSGPVSARPAPDNFADLAAKLLPSVVNVATAETVTGDADDDDDDAPPAPAPTPAPQAPPGSPFEKLFREFMKDHGAGGGSDAPDATPNATKHDVQSLGSGFVIDPSGLIVTNEHVVKGADSITVTLQDNSVLKARVVGHDDGSDLALLKVDPSRPLPAVSFGNSDRERVGDWVLAIGNPFGLSGTVTAGIVSSRGRSLDGGSFDDFIQTDAPINRGNSGGPLFDMDGKVIGINAAIYSPSGGSIGIGFAIPSNEAGPVIEQLRRFGRVRRGAIGVRVQDLAPDMDRSFGLPDGTKGALVAGVDPGGPAAKAGIVPGDVIEAVAGTPVDGRTLPRAVGEATVGEALPVTLWRRGRQVDVSVTVDEAPAAASPAATPAAPPKPSGGTAVPGLGFAVTALDDAARSKAGLGADGKGVAVVSVAPKGPAASAGLAAGDVVEAVGNDPVPDPAQLRALVEAARTSHRPSVALLLQNGDSVRWVQVPLGGAANRP